MPRLRLNLTTPTAFAEGLAAIHAELGVPAAFPATVDAAAEDPLPVVAPARAGRAPRSPGPRTGDRRPPGSRDLDRNLGPSGGGAGTASTTPSPTWPPSCPPAAPSTSRAAPGASRCTCPTAGPRSTRRRWRRGRGAPVARGRSAGGALDPRPRPAGRVGGRPVERATVRSRRQLDYRSVQAAVDDGSAALALQLLREVGLLREEQEHDQGGVSLNLPSQAVEREADGTFALRYDGPLPAEGWNEQISLLTGMAAAQLMLDAGVGLVRALRPRDPTCSTRCTGKRACAGCRLARRPRLPRVRPRPRSPRARPRRTDDPVGPGAGARPTPPSTGPCPSSPSTPPSPRPTPT